MAAVINNTAQAASKTDEVCGDSDAQTADNTEAVCGGSGAQTVDKVEAVCGDNDAQTADNNSENQFVLVVTSDTTRTAASGTFPTR